MIDNAGCLDDFRVPPLNHLELLKGAGRGNLALELMISTAYALMWREMITTMWRSFIITKSRKDHIVLRLINTVENEEG